MHSITIPPELSWTLLKSPLRSPTLFAAIPLAHRPPPTYLFFNRLTMSLSLIIPRCHSSSSNPLLICFQSGGSSSCSLCIALISVVTQPCLTHSNPSLADNYLSPLLLIPLLSSTPDPSELAESTLANHSSSSSSSSDLDRLRRPCPPAVVDSLLRHTCTAPSPLSAFDLCVLKTAFVSVADMAASLPSVLACLDRGDGFAEDVVAKAKLLANLSPSAIEDLRAFWSAEYSLQ
ncbi:hypothetical protein BZA70DRAFT_269921 [Myxozyma melibiosi]|uniref:Uncharacterized protein n=1 Tax=Myxozyma melibiosi TaxID=54550 RepID=A0ABR1EYL8_9ASCO